MKANDDQSKSSENIRHGTISSFCTAVFVKEDRESGAEAVFVYATKSQRATRQSQRLRVCRAIESRALVRRNRTCDIGLMYISSCIILLHCPPHAGSVA